jgi:hypothetical protein
VHVPQCPIRLSRCKRPLISFQQESKPPGCTTRLFAFPRQTARAVADDPFDAFDPFDPFWIDPFTAPCEVTVPYRTCHIQPCRAMLANFLFSVPFVPLCTFRHHSLQTASMIDVIE